MTRTTRRHFAWRRLGAAVLLFCVLAVPADARQRDVTPPPDRDVLTLHEAAHLLRVRASALERLARRNRLPARRIAKQWRFNRQALLAWLNGDWRLIATAIPPDAISLTAQTTGRITGTGTSVAQSQTEPSNQAAPASGRSAEPIGEAPKERTAEDVFLRGQKVLLGPGEVTVDIGQFYSETDSHQFVTIDGSTSLGTVEQETLTTTFLGRVGILDETELFASTTFFNQDNDTFVGSLKTADSGRTEFGDVRLGVRRTLLKEGPGRPDIIATLDARIPTGDTSWAVGGGLAFVKSIDPVVLFANANYRHTFSRDFTDVTLLEAEDRIDTSFGYALALNDTLTLSMSISGVFAGATRFSGAELRQKDSYSMQFGLTSWLA
jgi:excisionase family DNA binding protein